jgi:hypothetical protein
MRDHFDRRQNFMSVTGFFWKTTALRLKEGDIKPFFVPRQQDANEVLPGNLSVEETLGRAGLAAASPNRSVLFVC